MKNYLRLAAGLITFCLVGQGAVAADIYVMKADGTNAEVSQEHLQQITDSVKQSVRNSAENYLVQSENEADFILEPFVVNQGNGQLALRIEKVKDGEVMAVSQDTFDWRAKDSVDLVVSELTNRAISVNSYVAGARPSYPSSSRRANITGDSVSGTTSSYSGSTSGEGTAIGGAIMGPTPSYERNHFGYYGLGVGPSFSSGLANDNAMFDIIATYNHVYNTVVTGKVIGDFNVASGSDSARFIDLGVGADFFMPLRSSAGQPYLSADLGYAFARDNNQNEDDNVAVGAGVGFKFLAQQLNYDINLHYQVLAGQIAGTNPSLLGLRAAVNF